MTSAFGLRLQIDQHPEQINSFWQRRLPKLLVPCVVVNIIGLILNYFEGEKISLWKLIYINDWVIWLLVCYLIFWLSYKIIKGYDIAAVVLVITFSAMIYALKAYITRPTWCPEVIGFIWGIILFHKKNEFIIKMREHWMRKIAFLCCTAGVVGICYLEFKYIEFWGDYLLKIVLGLLIIIFLLALNTKISIGNKIGFLLGNVSFEVYLLHGMVFGLIKIIMPQLSSGAFIIVSMIATVLLSVVAHNLSIRILQYSQKIMQNG